MNIPIDAVCQMLGERDIQIRILTDRIAALEKALAEKDKPNG
jgi:hypothetical protein